MNYAVYKFDFQTGVHFGTGMLNESTDTFMADQLFSALYMEAIKMRKEESFLKDVKRGNLRFSDTFPYINKEYLLPKPMIYIESDIRDNLEYMKEYKKLEYLPVNLFSDYINGILDIKMLGNGKYSFGEYRIQTMASVRTKGETVPYKVGTFYFKERCGLYVIIAYEYKENRELVEQLLESLSYTGIGGEKNNGLGKFILKPAKIPEMLLTYLQKESSKKMLLSVALPKDNELEWALKQASYQLKKRSGFIASAKYAEEWRKKRDLYVFSAGSCFTHVFEGDIYDVSEGGKHPVFRYAKPLFMGV